MASPTRDQFAPGKQARVSLSFSESIAQRVNQRCLELGCDPKDYVRYCVMRELDQMAKATSLEAAIDNAHAAHFRRQ